MHRYRLAPFLMLVCSVVAAAVQGPARQPQADLPSDRFRRHVETTTKGNHAYAVRFNGSVDGVMTRMPISYAAYKQGWQPNRYVRLENVGDADVVNPWLTVNGLGDWRTLEQIAAEATRGCATDAERARAIWEWERKHRFHACTWDRECDDAVKVHNVYGYTLCGDDAIIIDDLFRAAGLQTRPGRPVGHCVTEAFYDNDWHLLDGDEHVICLRRDNETIAPEAEVVRDHDLMKRTHTYSIGSVEDPILDQFSASLYGYEGERTGERKPSTSHTMSLTLRPGESLEWRWDHVGKEYSYGIDHDPSKPWQDGNGQLRTWGGNAYDNLRNGKWIYRVPLEKEAWRKGVVSAENVAQELEGPNGANLPPAGRAPSGPALRSADTTKPITIVWRLASPYVFVGSQIRFHYVLTGDKPLIRFSFSPDNKTWQSIYEDNKAGNAYATPTFDSLISPRGKPMYEYFIRLELQGGADSGITDLLFDNDVQMSLLGMPELTVGDNKLQYTDETPGSRQVKVTHAWMERTEWRPPAAPPSPLFPTDGTTVEGTQFVFKWEPATCSAGFQPATSANTNPTPTSGGLEARTAPTVADYHIEVCDRADMRWVISPNFEKLVSQTPSKGKAEWTIPFTGLLNPGTAYYWRVRAMDSDGVWGPWSKRWSFRCAAPGVPLKLTAAAQADGSVQVSWQPNPAGRKPAAYKVYGSDEQGFTASDVEYIINAGHGFCDTMDDYAAKAKGSPDGFWGRVKTPPNLVTKTEQTGLVVVGPKLTLPNTNKAFYRVVAIDGKGNDSGPSDYVAVPRPVVYTTPVVEAAVGQPYRYEPQSISSIGHLTCNGSYNPGFWHREKLTWTLEQAPAWLKLENGVSTGMPTAPGKYDVALKVTSSKQQEARQTFSVEVK